MLGNGASLKVKPPHTDREETLTVGFGASSVGKFWFCDGISLLRV